MTNGYRLTLGHKLKASGPHSPRNLFGANRGGTLSTTMQLLAIPAARYGGAPDRILFVELSIRRG
jgi:hypothetical protein